MKITFHGAAQEVTGSRTMVETQEVRFEIMLRDSASIQECATTWGAPRTRS